MKRSIAFILSLALTLACFSLGTIEIGKEVVKKTEAKNINKLYSEVAALTGEIENRVVVNSKRNKLEPYGKCQSASGYLDMYVFQYDTKSEAEEALEYYKSLDYVYNVDYDKRMKLCDSRLADVEDDARCYAGATDNIDDMIKLIKANYSNFTEIKVAVIDTGCQDNVLTHNVVTGLGNTSGADCEHGTKICTTIINNTLGNVKIYSYDQGDKDGVSSAGAATALAQASAVGCKLVNMSFGSYENDLNLQNAVSSAYNKGLIMFASAGNDKKKLTSTEQHYPSGYSQTIGIGAVGANRDKASFSNYGTGVNYYTAGVNIRAMYDDEEVFWAGTSSATPVMVCIATNILSIYPSYNFSQLKSAITIKASHSDTASYPTVDAYKSISKLINKTLPTAQFTYDLERDGNNSKITFHCDVNLRIYYKTKSTSALPCNCDYLSEAVVYNGDTIIVDSEMSICAVAYGDNMHKSEERVITTSVLDGNDYTFNATTGEISYCRNIDDKTIIVPSKINGKEVKSVGVGTFAGNTKVEEIIIPACVQSVGAYAFANCPKLKTVVALGATVLGRYAFEYCDNLKYVYFPKTTKLHNCALYDCPELRGASFPEVTLYSYLSSAFSLTDNVLSYHKTSHYYVYDSIADNGCIIYRCKDCPEEVIELTASELKDMWTAYVIGNSPDAYAYCDTMALFDVSNDGVINAKDYAIINSLIQ